jgi:hypothetical protein
MGAREDLKNRVTVQLGHLEVQVILHNHQCELQVVLLLLPLSLALVYYCQKLFSEGSSRRRDSERSTSEKEMPLGFCKWKAGLIQHTEFCQQGNK